MRIVLLANTAESMVWFRQPLMRRLAKAGHSVWVMAPDGPGVERIGANGHSLIPLDVPRGMAQNCTGATRRHSIFTSLCYASLGGNLNAKGRCHFSGFLKFDVSRSSVNAFHFKSEAA